MQQININVIKYLKNVKCLPTKYKPTSGSPCIIKLISPFQMSLILTDRVTIVALFQYLTCLVAEVVSSFLLVGHQNQNVEYRFSRKPDSFLLEELTDHNLHTVQKFTKLKLVRWKGNLRRRGWSYISI